MIAHDTQLFLYYKMLVFPNVPCFTGIGGHSETYFAVCLLFVTFSGVSTLEKVLADEYPSATINLITPYSLGGASDKHARIIAATAPKYLGQPVFVINKAGAAGVIGTHFVIRSKKDGYTLLSARVGSQVGVPALKPNVPYKWDDYTFLGLTEKNPFVLIVPRNSEFKTMSQLVSALKGGRKASFASAGPGTLLHFASLIMADHFNVSPDKLLHIPYKGGGAAKDALARGQVDFMWQNLSVVIDYIKDGKFRALAITSPKKLKGLEKIPTVAELGHPDLEVIVGWSGIFGPPELPEPIRKKWVSVLQELKSDSAFNSMLAGLGSIPDIRSPDETKKFVEKQFLKFKQIAKKLGLRKAK